MLSFFIRLFITALAVVLPAHYIPGLEIKNTSDAVMFGFILGLINAFIRPFITLLTIPINILTLGLFSLVINAITYWLASELTYGVVILNAWGAILGGGIVWIVGFFANLVCKNKFI